MSGGWGQGRLTNDARLDGEGGGGLIKLGGGGVD